jgi:hypothetical protein
MAALNATKEAIWLRVLLEDLGFPQVSATTLHADNLGCIALTNGTVTHSCAKCKGITQTLIPDTLAVKPKASQSTDGNLLWSVVYISDTACLRAGTADDTQPALADPHPSRRPWPVTGGYAAGVP